MNRLVRGTYPRSASGDPSLFGLSAGQIRDGNDSQNPRLRKNTGWYNAHGQKLGWGDLSSADCARISAELLAGELFIILGERESFWDFVTDRNEMDAHLGKALVMESPGTKYVGDHALFLIETGHVYEVVDGSDLRQEETHAHYGISIMNILRMRAKIKIRSAAARF